MPSRCEPRGNYTLLNSQRIVTLTIIRNGGLNPLEFEWTNTLTDNNNLISAVSHKPTQFAFIFNTDLGAFIGLRTPGDGRRIDSKEFTSWNGLLAYFSEWISLLKREIEAPDMWNMLSTGMIDLELEPSTIEQNSTFTPEEQKAITTRLTEIRAYIQTTYSPTEHQLNIINRKLDLLICETKKQGRETWKYMAIGIIANVITALSITPEQGQMLWHYIIGKLSEAVTTIRLAFPK